MLVESFVLTGLHSIVVNQMKIMNIAIHLTQQRLFLAQTQGNLKIHS